jgi:hypothetical protein
MSQDMNPVVARRAPYPVRANHKRCPKCGKLVSRRAFECRRCGKRQRMRPRTILLGLAGGLLAAMFAIAAFSAVSTPSHPAEAATLAGGDPARAPAPAAARTARQGATEAAREGSKLTAADLWLEYARDPAGADRRFRDRPVIVSGTVRAVERDFDGRLMIRLSTGGGIDTVNAKLATRDDPAIAQLGKGRPLSLGCVGRGALIGAPLLGNCSVL